MFDKKTKLLFFSFGLIIGLLIGGIVVYYNAVITNQNKISVNLIPQIVRQIIGNINNATKATLHKVLPSDTTDATNKNTANVLIKNDLEIENLSAPSESQINTTSVDTFVAESDTLKEEELVIKKDELFLKSITTVNVLDYVLPNKQKQKSDSLLAIVSGTKDESKLNGPAYKLDIEYWTSPLKYRGYKLNRNKLIIYGLDTKESLQVVSLKNEIYMQYRNDWYALILSNNFNNFEKTTQGPLLNNLLNSLNK
jgi:hypothetical protein